MSHRAKKKPPSTQMYRHFAVITVVATGLLAMLAEGSGAGAVARRAEQPNDRGSTQLETEANRQPVTTAPQQPGGVWGTSSGPGFAASSAGSVFARSGPLAGDRNLRDAGYGPDYLSQFTPEERTELAQAAAVNTAGADVRKTSLEGASRLRSGSVGR
ncbi:hypothetical protein [Croceibacterium aestuarii]|uniref:hypothetical protein n=1 Tax=Croceibacterium aestuarii TaxID=3064139 RepID=UPI00272EC02F|nr:hypothetical protein [Croceibacterium sp. D39]